MAANKTTKPTKKSGTKSGMTAAHKAALRRGREEGRIVRHYLEALEHAKPRRGRKRTPQSIDKRLAAIDAALPDTDALSRVLLIQERLDLKAELAASEETVDIPAIEKEFIKVAKAYGSRKGISYSAWRSVGVSATALQKAGIARTRG